MMINITNRNVLLKIFSVLGVICGTYPLISIFAALNNRSVIFCFLSLIYLFFIALLATAHCFLFRKLYRQKITIAKGSYYFMAILIGIVSIVLVGNIGGMGKSFILLLVGTIYILVTNFYYLHYSKLTNIFLFLGVCLVNIAVMFSLSYMHQQQFQTGCILTFLFYSAVFGVTQNQANIDFLITRRNQSLDHLPKRIHRYNMKLFSILGIFLVIAFLFRKPLAKFVTYFCVTFLRGFFAIITMFLNLFKGEEVSLPPLETGIAENSAPNVIKSGSSFDILFLIVMIFIIVLVWLKRDQIIDSLKQLIRFLKTTIHRIFTGEVQSVQHTFKDTTAYTDYVEDIDTLNALSSTSKKDNTQSWNKRYKEFLKMPNNEETFRIGYSLLIDAMCQLGVEISSTDTPLDILEKCQRVNKHITFAYNNVRYGENSPTALDYSALCNILSNLQL